MQPQYKFYATLLDAFVWYQQDEREAAEQAMIDKINRVPITDIEALERMQKGTELNELLDGSVQGMLQEPPHWIKPEIVNLLTEYLEGAVPQYRTSMLLDVNGVTVELYGDIDYVLGNKAIDLKTTSSYELGKYKDSMQRHLYPLSLHNEGVNVDEFEFLVTDFNSIYKEPYAVDLETSKQVLTEKCAGLIEFLNAKKHLITDKKVFGLA